VERATISYIVFWMVSTMVGAVGDADEQVFSISVGREGTHGVHFEFGNLTSSKELRSRALGFAMEHQLSSGFGCVESAVCVGAKIAGEALRIRSGESALGDPVSWQTAGSRQVSWQAGPDQPGDDLFPQHAPATGYAPDAAKYICPALSAMFPLISSSGIT